MYITSATRRGLQTNLLEKAQEACDIAAMGGNPLDCVSLASSTN